MKKISKLLTVTLAAGIAMASFSAKAALYFQDNDRVVLRSYVTTLPQSSTTVTYYNPGSVIPETVTYTELPVTVSSKLVAPPQGDKYVVIGRNVYLLNPEKRMIVDAIKLEE